MTRALAALLPAFLFLSLVSGEKAQASRVFFYQCQFSSMAMWNRAQFVWKFVRESQLDLNEDDVLGACHHYSGLKSYCYSAIDDKGTAISCSRENLGKFVLSN